MSFRMLASVIGAIAMMGWNAHAEPFHRQTFEGKEPVFKLGLTDGEVKLLRHGMEAEPERVHSGSQSERITIQAASGRFCFVEYPIAPSLVFEELDVSIWINSSRPGTTLAVRVVLPNELDPDTKQPLVTLLKGDVCDVEQRWRRLFVRRLDVLLEQQQQLLQAQRKTKVDTRGAYIDQVLLNIHCGIGEVDVQVDDLEAGPLVAAPRTVPVDDGPGDGNKEPVPVNLRDQEGNVPRMNRPGERRGDEVPMANVVGDQLQLDGRPFFMVGMRRTEAPIETIKEAGVNTLFIDWPIPQGFEDDIARSGLQFVPMLPIAGNNSPTAVPVRGGDSQIRLDDRAIGFYVGGGLNLSNVPIINAAVDSIRSKDTSNKRRPVLGDVSEGLRPYSRNFDMIGVRRDPLFTTLELGSYRKWLVERKNIGRPGSLFWTWVQTDVPESHARLLYGPSAGRGAKVPLGPQPEQIKLLAVQNLAAGYRGIVYSTDQSLAESAHGRDRLLQIALFNLELSLIEPFLAGGKPPLIRSSSNPRVDVAIFRHERGVLVMPFWNESGSQYVIGQASINDLQVIVESTPEAAQAFQISPGEARGLKQSRDLGGIRITIPEFDTVAMVVLSTDVTLFARYQELTQQISQRAATWEKELAEITLAKTEEINARLETAGHAHPHAREHLASAREILAECRSKYEQGDYRMAFANGARSRRACRLLQHQHWTRAVTAWNEMHAGKPKPEANRPANKAAEKTATPVVLNGPLVSEPYLTSFYTLPEHFQFLQGITRASFGPNQIASGDFEQEGNLDRVGWEYRPCLGESLESNAMLVGDSMLTKNKAGLRVLELTMQSKENPLPIVLEDTQTEMISPPVAVRAGQVVRISGKVRLPLGVGSSVDGAMIWDSIGGKSLALRVTAAGDWRSSSSTDQ
ncbi:MAG: hypothetical protein U1D30_03930 [Planctomycetota bacterium]